MAFPAFVHALCNFGEAFVAQEFELLKLAKKGRVMRGEKRHQNFAFQRFSG